MQTMQTMQTIQTMQNMQNMQKRQNMRDMRDMQNMQNSKLLTERTTALWAVYGYFLHIWTSLFFSDKALLLMTVGNQNL